MPGGCFPARGPGHPGGPAPPPPRSRPDRRSQQGAKRLFSWAHSIYDDPAMAAKTPTAPRPPVKKRTLYEILGVPRDAMAIDIGVAYKKRLAELDRTADVDPNEVSLVREAYHILCQPREREAYDGSLITREEREAAKTRPAPDIVLDTGD